MIFCSVHFFINILFFGISYAEVTALSAIADGSLSSTLKCIYESHHPKTDTEDVDIVIAALKRAEEQGMPYDVFIEYHDSIPKSIRQDLLTNLLPRCAIELKNTSIENIDFRKMTNKACALLKHDFIGLFFGKDAFPNLDDEYETINKFLGKPLQAITFNDIFVELQNLLNHAESIKECYKTQEPLLADRLNIEIDTINKLFNFLYASLQEHIEAKTTIFDYTRAHLMYEKLLEVERDLSTIMNLLFDINALDKVLSLLKKPKKNILLIAGGYHVYQINSYLSATKRYTETDCSGLYDDNIPVPDRLLERFLEKNPTDFAQYVRDIKNEKVLTNEQKFLQDFFIKVREREKSRILLSKKIERKGFPQLRPHAIVCLAILSLTVIYTAKLIICSISKHV